MKKALLVVCGLFLFVLASCSHSPVSTDLPNENGLAKVKITADLNKTSGEVEVLAKTTAIGDGLTILERQKMLKWLKGRPDSLIAEFRNISSTKTVRQIFPFVDGKVDAEMEIFPGHYDNFSVWTKRASDKVASVDFVCYQNNITISATDENKIDVPLKINGDIGVNIKINVPDGLFEEGKSYTYERINNGFALSWSDLLRYSNGVLTWHCGVERMKGESSYRVGKQVLKSLFDITEAFDDDIVEMDAELPADVELNISLLADQPIKMAGSSPVFSASNVPVNLDYVKIWFDQDLADASDMPEMRIRVVSRDGTDSVPDYGYWYSGSSISKPLFGDNVSKTLKPGTEYVVEVYGTKNEFGVKQEPSYFMFHFTTED